MGGELPILVSIEIESLMLLLDTCNCSFPGKCIDEKYIFTIVSRFVSV